MSRGWYICNIIGTVLWFVLLSYAHNPKDENPTLLYFMGMVGYIEVWKAIGVKK